MMGYFEDKMGLPDAEYSEAFLKIDAEAGPWLENSQQGKGIDRGAHPRWDLDLRQQVIWFGNDERNKMVAGIQVLGTWDPDSGTWLWAWSNTELEPYAQAVAKLPEQHADIPEFCEPSHACGEAKAWALAAGAAFSLEGETCLCLPDKLRTFVALFDLTTLAPDDPRARRPDPDPAAARKALSEFIGPAAMHLGGLLASALEGLSPGDEASLDPIINALHACCENLDDLSLSPVGKGTPAAEEAQALAAQLRQAAQAIAIPLVSPPLMQGVQQVFTLLRDIAQQHDAWPDSEV